MRILHIVPLIGTNAEYGGPARGTMRQADALTENGHTVSVLSLWRGAKPTPEASSRVELVTFAARISSRASRIRRTILIQST